MNKILTNFRSNYVFFDFSGQVLVRVTLVVGHKSRVKTFLKLWRHLLINRLSDLKELLSIRRTAGVQRPLIKERLGKSRRAAAAAGHLVRKIKRKKILFFFFTDFGLGMKFNEWNPSTGSWGAGNKDKQDAYFNKQQQQQYGNDRHSSSSSSSQWNPGNVNSPQNNSQWNAGQVKR